MDNLMFSIAVGLLIVGLASIIWEWMAWYYALIPIIMSGYLFLRKN